MSKKYYSINLDDYGCPAFCTFSKGYIGSLSDITLFICALKDDPKTAKDFSDLICAYNEYVSGNSEATHRVCYHTEPLLLPAQLLFEFDFKVKDIYWEHTNVWGFPYYMHASSIFGKQVVVKTADHQIVRCIKPTFFDLSCHTKNTRDVSEYMPVNKFWGFPQIYKVDPMERSFASRLFQTVKTYESYNKTSLNIDEAIREAKDKNKLDFTNCLNDVFGDG